MVELKISLGALLSLSKPVADFIFRKVKGGGVARAFRVEHALSSSIASVWDSFDELFESEGTTEAQIAALALACERELRPFAEDPNLLLDTDLSGEKLFEMLRRERPFPAEIVDAGIEPIYRMCFPLVAALLCEAPVIAERIEAGALEEVLSRFSKLSKEFEEVGKSMLRLGRAPVERADGLFFRASQQATKKLLWPIDTNGLYGDAAPNAADNDMFIVPAIQIESFSEDGARVTRTVPGGGIRASHQPEEELSNVSVLGSGSRTIMFGAPGAGKSTWSRWVQLSSVQSLELLLLVVNLRAYAGAQLPTVGDLLRTLVGGSMYEEIDSVTLSQWIQGGRVGILFDGFDEVAPEYREATIQQIKDLANYLGQGPCILTSRPLGIEQLSPSGLQGWARMEIRDFDEERIIQYITQWYVHTVPSGAADSSFDAAELYKVLTRDPHVSPLTTNPLMLSTLLMVHHNDGELPKGRSRLYARYIDGMLGVWDDRHKVKADRSGLDREQKRNVLTALAAHMQLRAVDQILEVDALAQIEDALQRYGYNATADTVLDSLRERSGLVIGPEVYTFSHKSVGEYLVSQCVVDGALEVDGVRLDRLKLLAVSSEDRWLNVLYFWAGSVPRSQLEEFVDELISASDMELALGVVWDQANRFEGQWLGKRLSRILRHLDGQTDIVELRNGFFSYRHWDFGAEGGDELRRSAHGALPTIRHVSSAYLGKEEMAELLEKCREFSPAIRSFQSLPLRNLVVPDFDLTKPLLEQIQVRMEDVGWPKSLVKTRLSLRLIHGRELDGPEEAAALWESAFSGKEDRIEVFAWLAAAVWMPSHEYKFWDDEGITHLRRACEFVADSEWPDRSRELFFEVSFIRHDTFRSTPLVRGSADVAREDERTCARICEERILAIEKTPDDRARKVLSSSLTSLLHRLGS